MEPTEDLITEMMEAYWREQADRLDPEAGALLHRALDVFAEQLKYGLARNGPVTELVSPSVPKETPGRDECHGDHAENDKGYSKCATVHRSRTYTTKVSHGYPSCPVKGTPKKRLKSTLATGKT